MRRAGRGRLRPLPLWAALLLLLGAIPAWTALLVAVGLMLTD